MNVNGFSVTAYIRPEPQGSTKAFVVNGKALVTSANPKLTPYRSEVTRCAIVALRDMQIDLPFAEKHVPVSVAVDFYLRRPDSLSRKHRLPARKPDIDKLLRATLDALTGVGFHDDGQVVEIWTRKLYDGVERAEIHVKRVDG